MNAQRAKGKGRGVDGGGLPPDDDLAAFAAAADAATGDSAPAAPSRPELTAVPPLPDSQAPESPPLPAHGTAPAGHPPAVQPSQPAAPADDDGADEDSPSVAQADLIRQATINVDADVAQRFRKYQSREGRNGPTPSNVEVIFRAIQACEGRYSDIVASHLPQAAPGRRVGGGYVPGRRVTREARLSGQINYRPTYGEVADVKRLQKNAGAPSVSAFLNAILDDYLPPLRRTPRSPGQP